MKKASAVLKSHAQEIMDLWEKEVQDSIDVSENTSQLALRNQLPHVITDMAGILERHESFDEIKSKERYEEIVVNSKDHGRHRAATANYTVNQILAEYIEFHRCITRILQREEVYTIEIGDLLKYTLETAMLNAASAFYESLQQMREKLLGTLTHDIRNPIASTYMSVEMMDYGDGKEEFERMQQLMKRTLKEAIDLMEGLLESIRIQVGEGITMNFKELDLVESVKSVYKKVMEVYERKIHFTCKQEEIRGVFDHTATHRALENLLSNAIKYGSEDHPITVTLEDQEEAVALKVHNYANAIPPAQQKQIFQFLQSTGSHPTTNFKSWGMGLTLVKIVAEAHGGSIELQSNEEEGTTFAMILKKHSAKPGKVKSKLNYAAES